MANTSQGNKVNALYFFCLIFIVNIGSRSDTVPKNQIVGVPANIQMNLSRTRNVSFVGECPDTMFSAVKSEIYLEGDPMITKESMIAVAKKEIVITPSYRMIEAKLLLFLKEIQINTKAMGRKMTEGTLPIAIKAIETPRPIHLIMDGDLRHDTVRQRAMVSKRYVPVSQLYTCEHPHRDTMHPNKNMMEASLVLEVRR